MRSRTAWAMVMVLSLTVGFQIVSGRSATAGAGTRETGVLKLMVVECIGFAKIDNADVEVVIYRPGVGNVDSDAGYTDDGYIEFTFSDLEVDDEARVTVDANSSESQHTYIWVDLERSRSHGFDLGVTIKSICQDEWWNPETRVFKCKH